MQTVRRLPILCSSALFVGVALLFAPGVSRAETPAKTLRALERLALPLAKKGRGDAVAEILDVLRELGLPTDDVAKTRAECDKALAKAKKRAATVPDASAALVRLAADLADGLDGLEGDERARVARCALRLSGRNAAAHAALGHMEHEGAFVPAGHAEVLERRARIQEALRAARRMEIAIDESESGLALLEAVYGRKGYELTAAGVSLHAVDLPRPKAERMLRTIAQARAVSNFLRTGELRVPAQPAAPKSFAVVPRPQDYAKAVRASQEAGKLSGTVPQAISMVAYYDERGALVFKESTEATFEAFVLYHMLNYESRERYGGDPLGALAAGHLNWIDLAFLGTWAPQLIGDDGGSSSRPASDTSATSAPDPERDEAQRLSRAGIAGTRTWMQFLAARGEDPAWSTTGVAVPGIEHIVGEPLLKCTFVAEYLQERGELDRFIDATIPAGNQGKSGTDTMAPLVQPSFADFERRWKEWLFADDGGVGLAERLAAPDGPSVTPAERKLLTYLDQVRLDAIRPGSKELYLNLALDRPLSDGCRAHARYLLKHPEQQSQWPEAHEEFPDHEGFSVEGSRAGLSSVIFPGGLSPTEAVDGWLGTFYHRLPLLDPGVVRIGFGEEGGVTVLDATSMVRPFPAMTWVPYPHEAARGVPTAFVPELPNPVPGQDPSSFGYPVSVQFFSFPKDFDVKFTLHEGGSAKGTPVDCWLSSPSAPTNPRLAPPAAFCLIPKAHLRPNTTYTARVEGIPDNEPYTWSFTTGR